MSQYLGRGAWLAIGLCLAAGAKTLFGMDFSVPKMPAPRAAFQVLCAYPSDALDLNRFGGPCPLPPEALNKGGLPCQIQQFAHQDPEPRRTWLYEYDSQGRVVASTTRHLGRPTISTKYEYEQTGDSLVVKQADWVCGAEPEFKRFVTYHFDPRGYLSSVEGVEKTINLSYQESRFSFGTGVFISGGDRSYSFQLNRHGEVEERNLENSTEYPTTLDYEHENGHISAVAEHGKDGRKLYELHMSYDHDRMLGVDIKTFSSGRYMLEEMKMTYECKVFPTCEGVAAPKTVATRGGLPTVGMPDLSGAARRDPRPALWADTLRKSVNKLRSSSGKPALKWDDALNDVAQRDAEGRGEGEAASDMDLVRLLGYAVPVRVERTGSITADAEPTPAEIELLSEEDVWESLARRRLGMGLSRLSEGKGGEGRFAMVLVSADKSATDKRR